MTGRNLQRTSNKDCVLCCVINKGISVIGFMHFLSIPRIHKLFAAVLLDFVLSEFGMIMLTTEQAFKVRDN